MTKLEGKRILVIGGTSGFGKQIAKQALKEEAFVQVIGRNEKRLQNMLQSINNNNLCGKTFDAQDQVQLKEFFENQSSYDHIVSMLGGAMSGGFLENSIETVRQTIEDKFFANLQLIKVAHPFLRKNGSFIFTSGTGGHPSTASGAIVGNNAINALVVGTAIELAPYYRVNAVAPTWTPTGLWNDLTPVALKETEKNVAANIPLKKVATTAEVASAYLYLMTNDFITGQIINVDGGTSAL